MQYDDLMLDAARIAKDRVAIYGDMRDTFPRVATLASAILGRPITAYDVLMIMHALKLDRIRTTRTHKDSYVDGLNYLAYAATFAADSESEHAPVSIVRGGIATRRTETTPWAELADGKKPPAGNVFIPGGANANSDSA